MELPNSGTMIFSGDAIHVWENAEKERPFNGFYNLQDAYESIRRLKMLAAVTEGHPRPQPRSRHLGDRSSRHRTGTRRGLALTVEVTPRISRTQDQ